MALCIPSRPEIAPARSLVIAAGDGRDLAWPHPRIAAELLERTGGRQVHLLLHGGARSADAQGLRITANSHNPTARVKQQPVLKD